MTDQHEDQPQHSHQRVEEDHLDHASKWHHFTDSDQPGQTLCGLPVTHPGAGPVCPDCDRLFRQRRDKAKP